MNRSKVIVCVYKILKSKWKKKLANIKKIFVEFQLKVIKLFIKLRNLHKVLDSNFPRSFTWEHWFALDWVALRH